VNDEPRPRPDAEAVADFLRRHPEFFEQHPALLAELRIPHDRGDAVSLVERQVAALREQNQNSRQRLLELFDIARRNQELATRMHQLALSLMDAGDPRDIFATLYDNLRRNFNAERVVVRLFAKPAFIDFYPGEEFVDPGVEEAKLFRAVIERGKPLTGTLKRQQQVFLFGDAGDDIHSAVLVPLKGERWGGVLAIGSPDPERFTEHMGVELITNLGEMLSLILKPWISRK
jgi:hypothetical protein